MPTTDVSIAHTTTSNSQLATLVTLAQERTATALDRLHRGLQIPYRVCDEARCARQSRQAPVHHNAQITRSG